MYDCCICKMCLQSISFYWIKHYTIRVKKKKLWINVVGSLVKEDENLFLIWLIDLIKERWNISDINYKKRKKQEQGRTWILNLVPGQRRRKKTSGKALEGSGTAWPTPLGDIHLDIWIGVAPGLKNWHFISP